MKDVAHRRICNNYASRQQIYIYIKTLLSIPSWQLNPHINFTQNPWMKTSQFWYRTWYQDWGYCGLTNDPEARHSLWWASRVVLEATIPEIKASSSILLWWHAINEKITNVVKLNARNCPKTVIVTTCLHVRSLWLSSGFRWPDSFPLATCVATAVMS